MIFFEEEITSISYNCDDCEDKSCDLVECGYSTDNDDSGHDSSYDSDRDYS